MILNTGNSKISKAQIGRLYALSGNRKNEIYDVIAKHGYEDVKSIDKSDYEAICEEMQKEDISEVFYR